MRSTYLDLLAKYGIDSAHPGGLPLTKILLNNLQINNNTKLIDLGCGTGQTLSYIARNHPCKAIGVDINKQMLKKAAQRFKVEKLFVELVRADLVQLPFASKTYDIALSESVTIFTNISKALYEYARILKTGGSLLAIEMTAAYPFSANELSEIKSVYGIEQLPTFNEWEGMLKNAGFKNIQAYTTKIDPTLKLSSTKMIYDFYPHLRILSRYSRKLEYMIYQCII